MDKLVDFLATNQENWKPFHFSQQSVLQVTEVWETQASSITHERKAEHRNINGDAAIQEWLSQGQPKTGGKGGSLLWRAAWMPYTAIHTIVDLQKAHFDNIVESFGLENALKYALTLITSAMRMTAPASGLHETWILCLNPKLCAIWSRRAPGAHINAIIIAEPGAIDVMKDASDALLPFASHATFTAIICAVLISGQVHKQKDTVKTFIRTVETRTGYHRFRRTEPPAQGELAQLSASVSGHRLKLASDERKARAVQEMHEFILAEDQRVRLSNHVEKTATEASDVQQLVELLEARVKMHFIDFEYVQRRIEVQLSAIFHLITRRDNHIGLQIAESSHKIAESSQRDASAMKLIAIVTMAFLPGTFVASLFDMPLFNWSKLASPSQAVNPGFGIYWAVTIPLTLATFGIWVIWTTMQRRAERRKGGPQKQALERQQTILADSVAPEAVERADTGFKHGAESRVTTWQPASTPPALSPTSGHFPVNGDAFKA